MDVASVTGSGLFNAAQAIRAGQTRYDDAAAQVITDTMSATSEAPSSLDSLPADVVGMQVDSIMNNVLYGLFRRQSQQQQDLLKIISPPGGP